MDRHLICAICGREFPSNASDIEVDTHATTEDPNAYGACTECGGDVYWQEIMPWD